MGDCPQSQRVFPRDARPALSRLNRAVLWSIFLAALQLVPHVLGGLLAILIGPLQFWARLRRDYVQVHRWSGRVYLAGVVVGGNG